jgi:hypothetical protein
MGRRRAPCRISGSRKFVPASPTPVSLALGFNAVITVILEFCRWPKYEYSWPISGRMLRELQCCMIMAKKAVSVTVLQHAPCCLSATRAWYTEEDVSQTMYAFDVRSG